jgi:hypothetical protein
MDWALAAKELAERWYPIIAERLHPNLTVAPVSYKLKRFPIILKHSLHA